MKKFEYGVTCKEMIDFCGGNYNDSADWFDDLNVAMKAATELRDEGFNGGSATDIEIRKFDDGECAWDYPIMLDKNGFWSDDQGARVEMGCI